MNLAPDDDPVEASWPDVSAWRPPLAWREELEKRAERDKVVTLVGPWKRREAALWLLAEKLQKGNRVLTLGPKLARAWTYGKGAAETLGEVFTQYQVHRAPNTAGSALAPLVWETLGGWASGHSASGSSCAVAGLADPAAWAIERWQTTDNERERVNICLETQQWLVGLREEEMLPVEHVARPFQFLLMSHHIGLLGRVHLGFDGLDSGSEYKLKSIEKLLFMAQECVTPFSFVLGWSGHDEALKRLASELPELATELKRTAFYLP